MIFLKTLLIVVEVLCCLLLVGLILLQRSKSEGLGLAFGAGAGEALFGARAGNVLSKATVILGIVFMVSTLALGVVFAQKDKALIDALDAPPAAGAPVMQPQPLESPEVAFPQVDTAAEGAALPAEPAGDETM
jgi:preprotein translocase subunit SecG